MNLLNYKATKNDEGRTIFKFLTKVLNNTPISRIEKSFRKKDIKLNGVRVIDKNIKLNLNDIIEVYGLDNVSRNDFFPTDYSDLKINHEDENILIIDKKSGVVVHGEIDSLDNKVLSYLKFQQTDSFKPSHVGRLDKDTSGLIVYAKNYKTLVQLNEKTEYFDKYYLLKSDYEFDKKDVTLYTKYDYKTDKYLISEKPNKDWIMMRTIFYKEKQRRYAKIITGKKHQIRLSLSYLGFPIYGDRKYNGPKDKRLRLHSFKLVFKKLNDNLEYLNNTIYISNEKY
ncbi:MAG: pseudouridine synthase [Metamycoplasmataceae bacterium]